MKKVSPIWTYFSAVGNDAAICILCNKTYSRKGRGTTSLKNHLRSIHPDEYGEFIQQDEESKKNNLEKEQPVASQQEAKKQTTSQEAIGKNTSHPKTKEVERLITEMIALQDLPVNFVEGIGFRRLMHAVLPYYHLRGHQFFRYNLSDDIYPRLVTKIKQLLNDFESLSFTTDIWSQPNADVSLLSLICHGITSDFRRVSVVLRCELFEGYQTDDVIAEEFNDMLDYWEIPPEKVHSIIRNDDYNIKRAAHLPHLNDIDCTVHQIQLCVRAALRSEEHLSKLIIKCEQVVTHFNNSVVAQEELKQIQLGRLNQSPVSVVQDCPIRWNSTFYMMQRLLQLKDALNLYSSEHNIPQISPEDWLDIEKCVTILKPFEETTKVMSSLQASISSVIPLIHVLRNSLQEEKMKSDSSEIFKNVIGKLTEEMNRRLCVLQNNNLFYLATYLDPRYKLKFFNEIFKDKVQSEILSLINGTEELAQARSEDVKYNPPPEKRQKQTNLFEYDQPSTSSQVNIVEDVSTINAALANILDSDSDEDMKGSINETINQYMLMKALLSDYNKEKRLHVDRDPLLWWKQNTKYERFFNIVRQYLAPSPATVSSEQLFNGAGLLYNELKNRLKDDKEVENLLFIKYNLQLLNFEY